MAKKIITTQHHIVFDIDSSTIGAGLFRYGYDIKNNCIEVTELSSIRKNIINGSEYPFESFFERTLKTLAAVAESIYLESMIPLDGVHCNMGMPWMSAQKRSIKYKKDTPFLFTQELAEELIEKELSLSFSKNIDYANHDVALLDRQTVGVYANGYPTRNPIGKEMKDLSIESLTSVISKVTKQSFIDVIERVFHRVPEFTSNTFIRYQEVTKNLPHIDNAIVLDISGEVSEVLVIKDDHIKNIGSLPVGMHTIIRSLRDQLNIPIEKAKKMLHLYHDQKLDQEYAKSIDINIHNAFTEWFKPFFNLIDEYAKQGLLPHTIILRTHASYLGWFEYMFLKEDMLHEHIHTQGQIEVIDALNIESYANHNDYELAGIAHYIGNLRVHHESKKD